MEKRDRAFKLKDIVVGDLVVVNYPHFEWHWHRYKTGDMGLVMRVIHFPTYSVGYVKLVRTDRLEAIPFEYLKIMK